MAKYIELEDAYRTLSNYYHHSTYVQRMSLREALDRVPAADVVERKVGKWIGYPECLKYTNAYSDDHIVCSACEECFSILDNDCERFNYCPNCGAKMEVDEDDG